MGMTRKYSAPIYDMAEYVDALENDCTCKECMDCCLFDILEIFAKDVDALELLYDEKIKEISRLEQLNEALMEVIKEVKPIIKTIYDGDYGSQISDDLYDVLQKLEEV